MLPSMPILFTRESQDAFGNKIQPSKGFFSQNAVAKTFENPTIFQPPPPPQVVPLEPKPSTSKPQEPTKGDSKQNNGDVNVPSAVDYKIAIDTAIARNYYKKVQSKFASDQSVPTNKFVQFRNILMSFNPDTDTPVDLYRNIEKLLAGEHDDILEEFLLFLSPGQAAEVGQFMDHFALVQMSDFIQTLQITLSRKPTVLRKVLRAITNSVNTGCSEGLKKKVLPHLRSSPQLTALFKSLFPEERPPDSLYEEGFTTVTEETVDKEYDVWEFHDDCVKKRQADKDTLDTVYLHRVFLQHGRILKPARVTFPYSKEPYRVHARRLAPAHCRLFPSESDEERASPKRNSKSTTKNPPKRAKKQTKSPTKSVKDVNDNTKHKDCITNSPRVKKSQSNTKSKSNKKETEVKESVAQKRDRKDKNEAPTKAKQARIDTLESKKLDVKNTEAKSKVVDGKKSDIKVVESKSKTDIKVVENKVKSDGKVADKKSDVKLSEVKSKLSGKNAESKSKEVKSVDNKSKQEVKTVESKKSDTKSAECKNKSDVKMIDGKKTGVIITETIKVEPVAESKTLSVDTNDCIKSEGKKVTEIKQEVIEVKSNSWTRDEDKTMLQIIKGDASSEVFGKIRELLPHRTVTEIQDRFCHVMNLLQRMAVGEVT